MKVCFFSNFLNHHQLPFSLAMENLTDNNFIFVATSRIPQERLNLGYEDMNSYPFVLRSYDSPKEEQLAESLALDSDLFISGSAPEKYTRMRMERKKITFRYSERCYKKGVWSALSPKHIIGKFIKHTRYRNYPVYLLCASAYAPYDYSIHGAYIGKTYKWGYFPEVKRYDVDELMKKKCSFTSTSYKYPQISILWAGRLIDWKHPEILISLAVFLKQIGYSFKIDIIGNGEMELQLREMISNRALDNCVELLGAMAPDEVRKHMEKADIYLFTSDFNEGWGAVLNEAMNSGCAVVSSHAIGAVPFLIKDMKNGLIYENGNQGDFNAKVKFLIDNPHRRWEIGINAYKTIVEEWNADVAARRLLVLYDALQKGEDTPFTSGPCSKAEILKNNWYKKD